tara:strand:+ start:774 stop:983 length:210 start_codon:yes stop_codon:yes gene_type:complete
MSGLKKLLDSKRFWTALVTLAICVAVKIFNVPEETAKTIADTAIKLGGFLIGGISLSDTAMALKGKKTE